MRGRPQQIEGAPGTQKTGPTEGGSGRTGITRGFFLRGKRAATKGEERRPPTWYLSIVPAKKVTFQSLSKGRNILKGYEAAGTPLKKRCVFGAEKPRKLFIII